MRDTFSYDTYSALVCTTDDAFMALYGMARRNARRVTRLVITLVPLMALLVGSCKTTESSSLTEATTGGAAQFRTALFPDRATGTSAHYSPAAGYISQARDYVQNKPQSMMMLTREEIGYIFGQPALHRHDADADVWQYKTGACVVNFYFYGKSQLSYVDVRVKDGDEAFRTEAASEHEVSKCLSRIDAPAMKSSAA